MNRIDRDLAAAGIAKRDDRGRTLDVHALRTSFATLLSADGVSPRIAQAALRLPPAPSPPDRLRLETAAVRLSLTWFGAKKSLSADQKAQAAEAFGAAGEAISAGKKLLGTRHPKYRSVSAVSSQAVAYWKGVSLPFPDPELRLVRRGDVEMLLHRFEGFREELSEAVMEFEDVYSELGESARRRLAELFERSDYPERLSGLFAIEWDFPSVEPPDASAG